MRPAVVAGATWVAIGTGIVLLLGWPALAVIYIASWALTFGVWWWMHTWSERH